MHMPPVPVLLAIGIVIFLAIGIHEYCHCVFADMAGDPTPRFYGRVTLNLFKHFDPLGTIMIVISSLAGVGIGWGKPAPINPSKMHNPRWDTFIAVAAGPLSNLVQAICYAFALRIAMRNHLVTTDNIVGALNREQTTFLAALLILGVLINLSLFVFNLIPFGILDGHWLVGQLLPEREQIRWYRFNRGYGWQILLVIILSGQFFPQFDILGLILFPPMIFLFRLLTGIPL